jgi:hypothetical protein
VGSSAGEKVCQSPVGAEQLGPPFGDQLGGVTVVGMEAAAVVLEQLTNGAQGEEG